MEFKYLYIPAEVSCFECKQQIYINDSATDRVTPDGKYVETQAHCHGCNKEGTIRLEIYQATDAHPFAGHKQNHESNPNAN